MLNGVASPLFISILATGFVVAFLHGALPNHWLPFVLVGRRQGWDARKTLAITAFAGLCHAVITMLLGLIVVATGMAIGDRLGPVLPYVAGAILMALGLYYLARNARGGGHLHLPFLGRLAPAYGPDGELETPALSDRSAVLGLIAILALSPCEAFVPVYLSGLRFGWAGFGALSLVLTGAAVASMTGLTGLSLAGVRRLGLKGAERYEGALLGAALVLLGVLVILLER
jgi:hypothetical protein